MATRDQCPSCGTMITRPDPPQRGSAATGSETAVCPACGKWLWRRPGGAWEESG